ncbi:MAG TPA: hypothetical protein VF227_07780 [Actinomycetes bacterium]|jgi:predicted lipoprotein with Yx(FWY)xxD motif
MPGLRLLAGGAAVMILAAACGGGGGGYGSSTAGKTSAPSTGGVASGEKLGTAQTSAGTILVDGQGRTMYAFAADSKGRSNCTESCLAYWPAVPAGAQPPQQPAGVTAKLGVLHRQDGADQLTVDGWPMYTYVGDAGPGTTAGQGKNLSGGLWWVVAPSGKWITSAGTSGSEDSGSEGGYGTGY